VGFAVSRAIAGLWASHIAGVGGGHRGGALLVSRCFAAGIAVFCGEAVPPPSLSRAILSGLGDPSAADGLPISSF